MLWLLAIGGCVAASGTQRPSGEPPDSAAVVLSPRLAEPKGPGLARGAGWRALWADTVCLAVANTDRLGGGQVTFAPDNGPLANVVIARGADGRALRILPVDRDPVTALLPRNLRDTEFNNLLRDLVANVHPTAPLVAAGLYQRVGLDAIQPTLAVLRAAPDSFHLLDSLRDRPVWVEHAPELDGKPYGRFSRVITTAALLAQLRLDPTTVVATERYLASRLLDVLVGDRDRSPEHWLWGLAADSGTEGRWVPIAIRQEEAFLRAQGWNAAVLNQYEPGHQVFGPKMPKVGPLVDRGYDLDRQLLVRLDRSTWDSVSSTLAQSLTNDRIEEAIALLPESQRAPSQSLLLTGIASRRDLLPRIVKQFYTIINHYPDLVLSDADERVTVRRSEKGAVEILAVSGGVQTFHRQFLRDETEEIRLHLEGGKDSVLLIGVQHGGTGVRITSRSGNVALEREGPSTKRVVLYAESDRTRVDPPGGVRVVPRATGRRIRWQRDGYPPEPMDWGAETKSGLQLGYSGDLGVVAGIRAHRDWQGFEEKNYRQQLRGAFTFATKPAGARVLLEFERRDVLRNLHLLLMGKASGIDVVRFFGYGNETQQTRDQDFYEVQVREVALGAGISISSRPELAFKAGPFISFGSTDTTGSATLIAQQHPYGSGNFSFAGIGGSLEYSTLESVREPVRYQAILEVIGAPGWMDLDQGGFGRFSVQGRALWGIGQSRRLVLATRVGGVLLTGAPPFRQAARVGGPLTLRGFRTDRFSGDRGSAYGSVETRVRMFRFNVNFISADLGVLAFGDGGRVWNQGESSSTLHADFGGGLWASPSLGWLPGLDEVVARLDVAHSEEGTIFSVGTGFRF